MLLAPTFNSNVKKGRQFTVYYSGKLVLHYSWTAGLTDRYANYCKQTARQHSCRKNIGPRHGRAVNMFLSSNLIIMHNGRVLYRI